MGRNWAIAIGINEYDNLQSLNYAKQDAAAMRNYFLNEISFEKVYHFADDAPDIELEHGPPFKPLPTFAKLDRFLDIRFEQPFLNPGDNFWFFFAGHGKRHRDRDYLMPSDVNPRNIEGTAIPINDVVERLRRCGADNVILLLDACRNEGDRDGEGLGVETHQGVVTLFACSPSERSYEIDELQQGAFTHTLLQGLRMQGEGNCATVERLNQYLKYRVPELNQRYQKPRQTPYTAAEPISKLHLILLPRLATLADVRVLQNDAFEAEAEQNWELAEQLWTRVLTVSPGDQQAIKAIKRLPKVVSMPSREIELVESTTNLASRIFTTLIPAAILLAVISLISVVVSYKVINSQAWNVTFNHPVGMGVVIDYCRISIWLATAVFTVVNTFNEEAVLYISSNRFAARRRITLTVIVLALILVLAHHLYIGPHELCERTSTVETQYFSQCLLPYLAFLPYSIIIYSCTGVPLGSLYIHVILEDCKEIRNKRRAYNDFISSLIESRNLTQDQIEQYLREIEDKKLLAAYRDFCKKTKRHVDFVATMVFILSCDILYGSSTMSSSGFIWSQLFYISWFLAPTSITVLFILSEYQKIIESTLNFSWNFSIDNASLSKYSSYKLLHKTIVSNGFLHAVWISLVVLYIFYVFFFKNLP